MLGGPGQSVELKSARGLGGWEALIEGRQLASGWETRSLAAPLLCSASLSPLDRARTLAPRSVAV